MGKPQVTVADLDASNPVLLDNTGDGDWRFITGDFEDDTAADGARSVSVDFVIQADDPDTLHARYITTRSQFLTRDKRFRFSLDDAAASYLIDAYPGDGDHLSISSTIVSGEGIKTAWSMPCVLVVAAEARKVPAGGFAGVSVDSGTEALKVEEVKGAGEDWVRRVTGSLVRDGSDDAETLYAAARAALLTDLCLTSADGSRDATSGGVLTGEEVENVGGDGRRIDFQLQSEYSPYTFTALAAARSAELQISTTQPDEWDPIGGQRPTIIHVTGGVILAKSVWTAGILTAWETARSDIEAIIAAETGKSGLRMLKHEKRSAPDNQTLLIDAMWQADNATTLRYHRQESYIESEDDVIVSDSEGYHDVQESPTSPECVRVVSITRQGLGLLNDVQLMGNTPVAMKPGRVLRRFFRQMDWAHSEEDFGLVVRQSLVVKYRELKLRGELAAASPIDPNNG